MSYKRFINHNSVPTRQSCWLLGKLWHRSGVGCCCHGKEGFHRVGLVWIYHLPRRRCIWAALPVSDCPEDARKYSRYNTRCFSGFFLWSPMPAWWNLPVGTWGRRRWRSRWQSRLPRPSLESLPSIFVSPFLCPTIRDYDSQDKRSDNLPHRSRSGIPDRRQLYLLWYQWWKALWKLKIKNWKIKCLTYKLQFLVYNITVYISRNLQFLIMDDPVVQFCQFRFVPAICRTDQVAGDAL